jgi:CubicO group peptidase (beta-lactamase class C family)
MSHFATIIGSLIVCGLVGCFQGCRRGPFPEPDFYTHTLQCEDSASPCDNTSAGTSSPDGGVSSEIKNIVSEEVSPSIDSSGADTSKTPSMIVGIVTATGKSSFSFGSIKVQAKLPPTADSLYGIGSVSKALTGIIFAKKIKEGKFPNTDAKAYRLLPLSVGQYFDKSITLQQLATHYSGLKSMPENTITAFRDENNDGKNDSVSWSPGTNYSLQNFQDCLTAGKCKPQNSPGTSYIYSNLGAGLLGLIMAQQLGYGNYETLLTQEMTSKLGMNSTGTNNSRFLNGISEDRKAYGYDSNNTVHAFADMGILAGAGEVLTTCNDMIRLLENLVGLSTSHLDDGISLATTAQASSGIGNIGYAIELAPLSGFNDRCSAKFSNESVSLKGGNTAMHSAFLVWHKPSKTGLILMANRGGLSSINCTAVKILNRIINLNGF